MGNVMMPGKSGGEALEAGYFDISRSISVDGYSSKSESFTFTFSYAPRAVIVYFVDALTGRVSSTDFTYDYKSGDSFGIKQGNSITILPTGGPSMGSQRLNISLNGNTITNTITWSCGYSQQLHNVVFRTALIGIR